MNYLTIGFSQNITQTLNKVQIFRNFLGFKERMLKLLKIHPEFHESSLREQVDAKINNTPLGMAVVTVLGENISGMQQVQSGLGIMVIYYEQAFSISMNTFIFLRTKRPGTANTFRFLISQVKLREFPSHCLQNLLRMK